MNRNLLILTFITVAVALAIFLGWWFLFSTGDALQPSSVQTPGSPFGMSDASVGTSANGTGISNIEGGGSFTTILDWYGNSIKVNPFLPASAAGQTEGEFILTGDTVPEPSYLIKYVSYTDSFTLVLLKEPIAEVRRAGERYLLNLLGVTEADLCLLRYVVVVPESINGIYAPKGNLGFSFCPGAAQL